MYTTFVNISYVLLFLNFILYVMRFYKNSKPYKIFTYYLFLIITVQVIAHICTEVYGDNLFLSHFYFVGQFIFLNLFYKSIYKLDWQKKMANSLLLGGLTVIGVQYLIDPAAFFKFNKLEIVVTSFLIVILAVIHLYNMLSEKKEFYYATIGIIFYLFSSTILFLVGNLMEMLGDKYHFFPWTINAFLVILYHLFILYEWKMSFYKTAISSGIDATEPVS